MDTWPIRETVNSPFCQPLPDIDYYRQKKTTQPQEIFATRNSMRTPGQCTHLPRFGAQFPRSYSCLLLVEVTSRPWGVNFGSFQFRSKAFYLLSYLAIGFSVSNTWLAFDKLCRPHKPSRTHCNLSTRHILASSFTRSIPTTPETTLPRSVVSTIRPRPHRQYHVRDSQVGFTSDQLPHLPSREC